MIPSTVKEFMDDFEVETQPSNTYKIENNKVIGFCDGLDAIKQTIFSILNTERFDYLIYSWNYGIETKNLIGKSKDFVMSEIKRLIKEALTQDDRIDDVTDFNFYSNKNYLNVNFKVKTVAGTIEIEKVVSV